MGRLLAPRAAGPSPPLDVIEQALAPLITERELEPATRGRPELRATALRWGALLVCILDGPPSQRAIWRVATGAGLWSFAPVLVTPEAVRKRLVAQDPALLHAIVTPAPALLAARWEGDLRLAPFASGGVYALDDTTLDKVARTLTAADGGRTRPLAGRVHTVFDGRRQRFQTVLP